MWFSTFYCQVNVFYSRVLDASQQKQSLRQCGLALMGIAKFLTCQTCTAHLKPPRHVLQSRQKELPLNAAL